MKRYVLLIIVLFVILIVRNFYANQMNSNKVAILGGRLDSLRNVVSFYESKQAVFENSTKNMGKNAVDSVKTEIKARDSAIFSHGQQVRWLQWHVERLNKLNNQ